MSSSLQPHGWTVAPLIPLSMGIPQTRILEWVAVPSSRRSSRLRDQSHLLHLLHWPVGSLPVAPPAKPNGGLMLRANGRQAKQFLQTCGAICLFEWQVTVTRVLCMLDSILKRRDITLPTKVLLVTAIIFPVVMYACESWTAKKAEH